MLVQVNGEQRDVGEVSTLGALVESLGLNAKMLAVQHNERIVDRLDLDSTALEAGDIVELIRIVGGG